MFTNLKVGINRQRIAMADLPMVEVNRSYQTQQVPMMEVQTSQPFMVTTRTMIMAQSPVQPMPAQPQPLPAPTPTPEPQAPPKEVRDAEVGDGLAVEPDAEVREVRDAEVQGEVEVGKVREVRDAEVQGEVRRVLEGEAPPPQKKMEPEKEYKKKECPKCFDCKKCCCCCFDGSCRDCCKDGCDLWDFFAKDSVKDCCDDIYVAAACICFPLLPLLPICECLIPCLRKKDEDMDTTKKTTEMRNVKKCMNMCCCCCPFDMFPQRPSDWGGYSTYYGCCEGQVLQEEMKNCCGGYYGSLYSYIRSKICCLTCDLRHFPWKGYYDGLGYDRFPDWEMPDGAVWDVGSLGARNICFCFCLTCCSESIQRKMLKLHCRCPCWCTYTTIGCFPGQPGCGPLCSTPAKCPEYQCCHFTYAFCPYSFLCWYVTQLICCGTAQYEELDERQNASKIDKPILHVYGRTRIRKSKGYSPFFPFSGKETDIVKGGPKDFKLAVAAAESAPKVDDKMDDKS
jgi:hypothetical protein